VPNREFLVPSRHPQATQQALAPVYGWHQAIGKPPCNGTDQSELDRLEIVGFLFTKYSCGVPDKFITNWSETDYFVHMVSGRITRHTSDGSWRAVTGDTMSSKSGQTLWSSIWTNVAVC